jgi:deoxyribodipyrimidine photo-lyase
VTALLWLRRDLRLADHPALDASLRSNGEVVPVFCFDMQLLSGPHRSGPRTQFLLESLADLDSSLSDRGSRLVIRAGPPEEEVPRLADAVGARVVHVSADASPFARRRDARVRRALGNRGIELREHPGLFAVDEPGAIATTSGRPFTAFGPFHRTWLRVPRREVLATPDSLPPVPASLPLGRLPRLCELALVDEVGRSVTGGERAGRDRLAAFLAGPVREYHDRRDSLGSAGTSRLSPYLHLGCISAREVEHQLTDDAGEQSFRRQLCWRDFYAQVLHHHPRNARSEHQQRYRGEIRWSHSRQRFTAWCEGRTGYPLVDAAMRQLLREGWVHNRARLVAGSFLTKDLGIDWRLGERWFMRLLLDGDEANNNGNWQWIASAGADPEAPSRRMFNPTRQQARFDPDGAYVREYVPELRLVPDGYLAEPWRMPDQVQSRACCVIGRDYPAPIVDRAEARRSALGRIRSAAG